MAENGNSGDAGIAILIAAFGYFVYGGLDGAFGMVIFNFIIGITTMLISLIPGVGFLLAYMAGKSLFIPMTLAYVGLTATWLTSVIFGFYLILGFIVSMAAFAYLWNR